MMINRGISGYAGIPFWTNDLCNYWTIELWTPQQFVNFCWHGPCSGWSGRLRWTVLPRRPTNWNGRVSQSFAKLTFWHETSQSWCAASALLCTSKSDTRNRIHSIHSIHRIHSIHSTHKSQVTLLWHCCVVCVVFLSFIVLRGERIEHLARIQRGTLPCWVTGRCISFPGLHRPHQLPSSVTFPHCALQVIVLQC